jgi:transcriptional regulator with XRE-family HTH domain
MKSPRAGRPRTSKLKPAKHRLTRQVRRLIDVAHDGNVHEASKASGIPYATIRDLYTGKSTNPNLKTLETLARAYGVFAGWFTDDNQQAEVPLGGWVSYVSGFGEDARVREITIPFSAWPLPAVYERLCALLEAMPPGRNRPIIGEATNDKEISRLVCDYLLSPILNAEKITGNDMILHDVEERLGQYSNADEEKWILRMRRLGILWEEMFSDILPNLTTSSENH